MQRDYLGVGVQHPARLDSYGRQALVSDQELVNQSIQRILSTKVGSDFMNRAFGSYVHLLTFEPNSAILQSMLEYYISLAISSWENRVAYRTTDFTIVNATQLACTIQYTLLAGGQPGSYVFPFYRDPNA